MHCSLPLFSRSCRASCGSFALVSLFAGRKPIYSWMETQVGKQQRLSKARRSAKTLIHKRSNWGCWAGRGRVRVLRKGWGPGAMTALPHHVPGHKLACSWCWALVSHTGWWGLSRFQSSLVKWVLHPRNTQDILSRRSHIPLQKQDGQT